MKDFSFSSILKISVKVNNNTMTMSWKLLAAILLMMWIQETEQCLVLYPMDKIRMHRKQAKEIEEQQQRIKELTEKQTALYQEERELFAREPEYFPEEKPNVTDVPDFLPKEHGALGDKVLTEDEDYPVYPPAENDTDYDYTEFKVIAADFTEEKFEGEDYEDYYGEFFPNELRDKRDVGEIMECLMDSGEKLFSGNMVGSITSFLKTLAKPVYHYFIKTTMTKR